MPGWDPTDIRMRSLPPLCDMRWSWERRRPAGCLGAMGWPGLGRPCPMPAGGGAGAPRLHWKAAGGTPILPGMPSLHVQDRTLPLTGPCTIGRAKTCNLAIAHGSISREHARVWSEADGWWVEDLRSANGTTLNGRPIAGARARLGHGDTIQVGDVPVRFLEDGRQGDLDIALDLPAAKPAVRDPAGLAGGVLGGWAVQSLIRQEVVGPLYAASHQASRRHGQLWVLEPRIEQDEDPEFFQHFSGMLRTAASLGHPDIIKVYQCGRDDGLIWYATEAPAGSTLAQLVHGGFTIGGALRHVLALCRLVVAYHDAGLVHGDIKPSLVHVDDGGRVRLGSLGLAGLNSRNRRRLQAEGSTRQVFYLCPVQARTGDCNVRSDLYSIGCILVHLLTGRPPFIGANFAEVMQAHAEQPLPVLSEILELPPLIDEILAGLLAKDIHDRYDDLAPVIRELERLLAERSG